MLISNKTFEERAILVFILLLYFFFLQFSSPKCALCKGRNPLLLGARARDAVWSFAEAVERQNSAVLQQLCSLRVARIGREVMEFVSGSCGEEGVRSRFEEIGGMVEQRVGKGIVVDVGELEDLVNEKNGGGESEAVRYVIVGLEKLLEVSYGRLWLIGAATNYERYMKFVERFPSIDKVWDLQLLPILSVLHSPLSAQPYHTPRYGHKSPICQLLCFSFCILGRYTCLFSFYVYFLLSIKKNIIEKCFRKEFAAYPKMLVKKSAHFVYLLIFTYFITNLCK